MRTVAIEGHLGRECRLLDCWAGDYFKENCLDEATCVVAIIFVTCIAARTPAATALERQVAITFDDLPAAADSMSAAAISDMNMTSKLLTTLRKQKIPVVG